MFPNTIVKFTEHNFRENLRILPIDKIFCVLLPNLMVQMTITFKTYKMPWISWHWGSKIVREPFLASVCFVFMSASRTHQTAAGSNLAGSDYYGNASFFTEKVINLPKNYP